MARFADAAEEPDHGDIFSSPTSISGLQSPITPTATFRGRSGGSRSHLPTVPKDGQNSKLKGSNVQRRLFTTSGRDSSTGLSIPNKRPGSSVSFNDDSLVDGTAAASIAIHTPGSKTRSMKRAKISEAVCPATDHTLFSSSPKAGARLVPEASRAVTRLSRRLFVDVSSKNEMNATNALSCF